MGPTSKKKDKTKRETKERMDGRQNEGDTEFFFFFLKFLYSLLSQIHENLTVGIRRDKHGKCFKRRGLRVSTRNTGFYREFR